MAPTIIAWCKTAVILILISLVANGETTKKRVCIVGAGISGLAATKLFSDYSDEFEPIVFEKNSDVGGLWIYTDSTTVDEHGLPVHSSIYKNLTANGVKEMMVFPDYPNPDEEVRNGTFMKHEYVLKYLRKYADHFALRKYMQFNRNVEKVIPLPNLKWAVIVQNLNTKMKSVTLCDAINVCNGHDTKGYIPKIPGIESFTGKVSHSHVYRVPEAFADQTVVLLGAKFSAIEISVDISSAARKVYLSHRDKPLPDVFPSNLEQVPGVTAAQGGELILSNGTRIRADALVYCTGYDYDFPFLDKSSGVVVEEGKYIRSIYKHLINIEYPTMALINVPQPGINLRTPHAQLNYFRAVLRGELSLPSREQMLIDAQLPANVSPRKAHKLSYNAYFEYFDDLVIAADGEPLPWWFFPVIGEFNKIFAEDPVHFKDKRLLIHEDNCTVEYV